MVEHARFPDQRYTPGSARSRWAASLCLLERQEIRVRLAPETQKRVLGSLDLVCRPGIWSVMSANHRST